jgi:hypothetical protein
MKRWQWLALGLVCVIAASCMSGCGSLILSSVHEKVVSDLKNTHKEEIASVQKEVDRVKSQNLDDVLERIYILNEYSEKAELERTDAFEKRLTDAGACRNQKVEMEQITAMALESVTTSNSAVDKYVREAMTCGKQKRELEAENKKLKVVK